MKIVDLETWIVSVPFKDPSWGSGRGGTTEVIVRLTTDDGLIGWGESAGQLGGGPAIAAMVRHAAPLVLGRNPWEKAAIARDFFRRGTPHRWTRLAPFAFAGIDQDLWDLCGKATGQPVHRLLGGALSDAVDHCFHVAPGEPDAVAARAALGVEAGYHTFYLGCGHDDARDHGALAALRQTIGPDRPIRLDANERWTVNRAVRNLNAWDLEFGIAYCEAPVPHDLPEGLGEVRARVPCAIGANECLDSEAAVLTLLRGRAADVYCFAPYWVGTLQRFVNLAHLIDLEGLQVTKHTYGELGIGAAASHQAALCVPNLLDGNQQLAFDFADDLLTEPLPIASGPRWPRGDAPGLGIEVDEDRLRRYHEVYLRNGAFLLPEYRGA